MSVENMPALVWGTFCLSLWPQGKGKWLLREHGQAPPLPPGVIEFGTESPGAGMNTLQAARPQAKS